MFMPCFVLVQVVEMPLLKVCGSTSEIPLQFSRLSCRIIVTIDGNLK